MSLDNPRRMRYFRFAATILAFLLCGIRAPQAKMMTCVDADSHRGPQYDIDEYCRARKWICVADLTSSTPCRFHAPDDDRTRAIKNLVGDLAKTCPNYAWKEVGGVHLFAPAGVKESKLNVPVGPIHEKIPPSDLLSELSYSAGLPRLTHAQDCTGGSGPESLATLKMMSFLASLETNPSPPADERLRGDFKLHRERFGDAVIDASREFGPSFWLVECYGDDDDRDCGLWVDDYDDLTMQGYLTPR